MSGDDALFVPFARSELDQSIPARFEQQVTRFPNRLAVRDLSGSWSYRELDGLANRVARGILERKGAAPEPVALLLEQGAGLLAAILGALKAGKVYLPLDPTYPPAYNAGFIRDAGVSLVVGKSTPLAELDIEGHQVVDFDELTEGQAEDTPGLDLSPELVAYIYYTSGSTGRPKGVFDLHRNVLHNVMRYTNSLRIKPDDRLTLLQSPTFSGAVSSMFAALLNGAAVFPYDPRRRGPGRPLAEWLSHEAITVYHSVPRLFRTLAGGIRLPAMRVVRLEGDTASKSDVLAFRELFGPGSPCVLVNGLGATETGLTRQFFVGPDFAPEEGIVPVGYPTEDMRALILDETGRELDKGKVGEIAIRSRYLAAGYWNQPELTRQAFAEAGNQERIYRTGDLGRLLPDGCLEHLGRKDGEIKLHGRWVAIAELERALLALEAVRDAAAVVREDTPGFPQLVAYLVRAEGARTVTASAIRRALSERLPGDLLPTRVIFLDHLPLTPQGKVDRRALPPPTNPTAASVPVEYVAPRNALEEQLTAIWQRVLETSRVGVTDNFFDLGGDSLRAAAFLVELEQLAPFRLFPTTIYEAPTIAELAEILHEERRPSTRIVVPLQTEGAGTPCFFVHGHTGGVSLYLPLAKYLGPEQPLYGLQSPSLTEGEPLLTSIPAIAERLVQVTREVQSSGPYRIGGACFGAVVAFEMAHQLVSQGERVSTLLLADVSPEEFGALMPSGLARRFKQRRLVELAKREIRVARLLGGWRQVTHLLRRIRTGASDMVKTRLIARYETGGRLPDRLREVPLVNKAAFSRYVARPFPGHATLILRAEDEPEYRPDARTVWRRLATRGTTIHYVPGAGGSMWLEPSVAVLAAAFRGPLASPA